ncbi:MAG: RsmD family RNA methyltransferase [Bacteroidales bacterium]|nr:RsmD family RNA methyltransferase [Bacteroidales bacterium]
MRIISGIYGRRRFHIPKNFNARPTTDFAKENLFNVLQNYLNWETTEALDLFSGTGSIAFEFLSRGCPKVVCIEKDSVHFAFIRKVAAMLNAQNLTPVKGDVLTWLIAANLQFDLIFADPPYNLPDLPDLPNLIFDRKLVKENGMFILEHPDSYSFKTHPHFFHQRIYGSVNFSFFK